MSTSYRGLLSAISSLPITRPPGLLEELHYGFGVRYGLYREHRVGALEWNALEEQASEFDACQLAEVLPILAARAWEAGSHECIKLALALWSQLNAVTKGEFLAGISRHLNPTRNNEENKLAEFFGKHLRATALNAQAVAEIAANAIIAKQPAVFEAVLVHPDFDRDARVSRLADSNDRFSAEILQHATRTVDVLLECAVRCLRPDAVERLLVLGADPNLPCWNLERSFSDWFSLLSYALNAISDTDKGEQATRIFNLLLDQGADTKGLLCEGLNHPLKLALSNQQWDIADRLLDIGGSFTGGLTFEPDAFDKPGRFVPAGHPHYGVRDQDLKWVEEKIAPLLSLLKPWQVPLFYRGDAQGGNTTTFLSSLLNEEHLDQLKHFESRGISTRLTPAVVIEIVKGGHYGALCHLLRHEPNLPRILFRARRRNPELGTSCLQAWLSQPQDDGINELAGFDPGEQEPLVLPDGSRFYLDLDAVAPPDHNHGPITSGCFWLQEHKAVHRRRGDHVIVRRLHRIWRMENLPDHDYSLMGMIPAVKVVNGRFFLPGICVRQLRFGQRFPRDWKAKVRAWLDGPARHSMQTFRDRIEDQLAHTPLLPEPALSETELHPYPQEFWPYLRRLEDGTIGITEQSAQARPDMLDFYTVWAKHNKPPLDNAPDPRVTEWQWWPHLPVELRPYFVWSDSFQKTTVIHHARNDYDRAMIQQAIQWNNAQFMNALKEAGL